jgi:hypothetical protein
LESGSVEPPPADPNSAIESSLFRAVAMVLLRYQEHGVQVNVEVTLKLRGAVAR